MEEIIKEPVHTEEIQDIIGKPPAWIYRWGVSLILIVLLLSISSSAFVSYPETVQTQLMICSNHNPYRVNFKDSVQLLKLCVQPGEYVKKGQQLADINLDNRFVSFLSPQSGKLTYAGVIHEGIQLVPHQSLFLIADSSTSYYGKMTVPREYFEKVKPGQDVLVNLKNFQAPEDILNGSIIYISVNPLNNNELLAEVDFKPLKKYDQIFLVRNGMVTDAKIIISRKTILQRLMSGVMNF